MTKDETEFILVIAMIAIFLGYLAFCALLRWGTERISKWLLATDRQLRGELPGPPPPHY